MQKKLFDGHFLSLGLIFSQKVEVDLAGVQRIIASMQYCHVLFKEKVPTWISYDSTHIIISEEVKRIITCYHFQAVTSQTLMHLDLLWFSACLCLCFEWHDKLHPYTRIMFLEFLFKSLTCNGNSSAWVCTAYYVTL